MKCLDATYTTGKYFTVTKSSVRKHKRILHKTTNLTSPSLLSPIIFMPRLDISQTTDTWRIPQPSCQSLSHCVQTTRPSQDRFPRFIFCKSVCVILFLKIRAFFLCCTLHCYFPVPSLTSYTHLLTTSASHPLHGPSTVHLLKEEMPFLKFTQ